LASTPIAPDTSITVDDGQAATLSSRTPSGFGIGAVVIGSALGYGLSQRSKAQGRKKS